MQDNLSKALSVLENKGSWKEENAEIALTFYSYKTWTSSDYDALSEFISWSEHQIGFALRIVEAKHGCSNIGAAIEKSLQENPGTDVKKALINYLALLEDGLARNRLHSLGIKFAIAHGVRANIKPGTPLHNPATAQQQDKAVYNNCVIYQGAAYVVDKSDHRQDKSFNNSGEIEDSAIAHLSSHKKNIIKFEADIENCFKEVMALALQEKSIEERDIQTIKLSMSEIRSELEKSEKDISHIERLLQNLANIATIEKPVRKMLDKIPQEWLQTISDAAQQFGDGIGKL